MLNAVNVRGVDKEATGRRIKLLMMLRGTDITEVSRAMGVSYQCVYKWIIGKSLPDIDNLVILCELLGVGVDTVLVRIGEKTGKKQNFTLRMYAYYWGLARRQQIAG